MIKPREKINIQIKFSAETVTQLKKSDKMKCELSLLMILSTIGHWTTENQTQNFDYIELDGEFFLTSWQTHVYNISYISYMMLCSCLQVTKSEVCIKLPLLRDYKVARVQDAVVQVYDYYEPSKYSSHSYC